MSAPTNVLQQAGTKQKGSENEIKVFISHRDAKCDECGEELGRQAWIELRRSWRNGVARGQVQITWITQI